ncbi:hypothetical protein B0E51_13935 [Rhodanobacter sp. C05]|nr:hypothetical protein B0E51_13935 [Rhodanobacter sp. C05]
MRGHGLLQAFDAKDGYSGLARNQTASIVGPMGHERSGMPRRAQRCTWWPVVVIAGASIPELLA